MANQEIINIGTLPNDGEGDPLRVAFAKINNNFTSLFATSVNINNANTTGNAANQIIFETAANAFTTGELTVYSADPITNESQTIKLSAQLSQTGDVVKFTGYGTTFIGNAVTTYDMAVSNGNVQILVSPLTDNPLFHFIASQTLWTGSAA